MEVLYLINILFVLSHLYFTVAVAFSLCRYKKTNEVMESHHIFLMNVSAGARREPYREF